MSEIEGKSDFEVRRQLLQMEVLYEVGVAISDSLDPAYVAGEILQRVLVMVDGRGGMLLMKDEEEGGFEVVGQMGLEENPQDILGMAEVGEAWEQRKMVQLERSTGIWHHLCIVPLESRQEVKGLLIVADREQRDGVTGPFDANDQALLHSFALQAGTALHNARLHYRLEEAYEQLQIAQRRLAQLEQLRALGDLAAETAHAMRHLLGIIVGRADMYLTFRKDPERAMQSILETAESGQEIIDRIHSCTRLGVGKKRVAADINALIQEAVQETRTIWQQREDIGEGEVEWQIDLGALSEIQVNPTDMREVFNNLLLNALEAMPGGGRLEVTSSEADDRISIRVADTGAGMSEEVRQRLFEPFFTTKEEVGTGLGLSIVYRIVHDHGGDIEVQSEPGQGSCFTLSLPITTPPLPAFEEEDVQIDLDR